MVTKKGCGGLGGGEEQVRRDRRDPRWIGGIQGGEE